MICNTFYRRLSFFNKPSRGWGTMPVCQGKEYIMAGEEISISPAIHKSIIQTFMTGRKCSLSK